MNEVLKIVANGAWNGGTRVDNSIYENKGMFFKRGIPVNNKTIEERIGVRARIAALPGEKIGLAALKDLLATSDIDSAKIKLLIGATNIGENRYDSGPLIRHPFEHIKRFCPDAMVMDLYAGCPGFNVSAEMIFMLSLSGMLKSKDLSIIVGAENLHREKVFRELDTSNIIFGDDAMATALETVTNDNPEGHIISNKKYDCKTGEDFVSGIAQNLFELIGGKKIDGIIIDNQLGKFLHRVPAAAARVQHKLVCLMFPEEVNKGTFQRFKDALSFYDENVQSFAFDIMTLGHDKSIVSKIAGAYAKSGRYGSLASVYLSPDLTADIEVHEGFGFNFKKSAYGIIDTLTRTHGCFAGFIQAVPDNNDVVGEMDGKGVFLHATRGAEAHLKTLFERNNITINDIDLLIEHQANFAMIPLTLEQILAGTGNDLKKLVSDYIANKMVINIHERGNCSVVCMQRLPYDLKRNVYKPDVLQGYPINQNLENLKNSKIILSDSVGSGMTRSSVLQIMQ